MTQSLLFSERFTSLQCEGERIGMPSIFLRAFGCNFTCDGWGRGTPPKDALDRFQINPENYSDFNELPIPDVGCDSYASWDPRFKDFSEKYTTAEIAEYIKSESEKLQVNDHQLIFTGGEPLLKKAQRFWTELLTEHEDYVPDMLTIETNGSQPLTPELADVLYGHDTLFAVAVKLSNTGEPEDKRLQPDVLVQYAGVGRVILKFVVGSEEDLAEADLTAEKLRSEAGYHFPVYLMPVGGTDKLYYENQTWLANRCLDTGFYYSPRLQINLFGNGWAT